MKLRPFFVLMLWLPACGTNEVEWTTVDPRRACSQRDLRGSDDYTECVLTFGMVRVPTDCVDAVERRGHEDAIDACLPSCDGPRPMGCVGDDFEVCAPFWRKLRLSCADLCAFHGRRYTGTCGPRCTCE